MPTIPEGCILFARVIRHSDIWLNKPPWWYKVWSYILMEVNHKDNKYFKRGENLFTYKRIYDECGLIHGENDTKSIDNLIRWLKRTTHITTRKTTRGFIITVCNYNTYQNLNNYRNDTQNDTPNETKTKQKRNTNDTINKNDKNVKNDIGEKHSFKIPTPKEVEEYAKSIEYTIDGERFIAHYSASGWYRGKTKIKDWRACVVTWKKTDKDKTDKQKDNW